MTNKTPSSDPSTCKCPECQLIREAVLALQQRLKSAAADTATPTVLTVEQQQRRIALQAARTVLRADEKDGLGPDAMDVVSLARYIETGENPWADDAEAVPADIAREIPWDVPTPADTITQLTASNAELVRTVDNLRELHAAQAATIREQQQLLSDKLLVKP